MQHKLWSRLLILVILVMVLTALGGSAIHAQDSCFGLSEADCEILTTANENMAMVNSFTYDLSADASVGGMQLLAMLAPGLPGEMAFSLASNGTFDGDNQAAEVFFDISADVDMESAAATGTLILVDDVVYMIDEDGQAYGFKPDDMDTADLPMDMDMESLDMAEMAETFSMEALTGMFTDFGMDPSAYVSFARLDNMDLMGQTMYPFEFRLDIGGLLNSPEFLQVIGMLAGVAEDDPTMGGMMDMVPTLMSGIESELGMTEYIGEDGYVHGISFVLDFTADLSSLFGPGDPVDIGLSLNLELDNINAAPAVVAPGNVTILSEEEAQAMVTEMFSEFEDLFAGLGEMMP